MFIRTTATEKLQALKKRIRGIAGGTSASKTISILLILIAYAQTHDKKFISVVSESLPHLKKGAMRDFLNIMQEHNYFKRDRWNKTDSIYEFETLSLMEFFSADSWEKVKGARRDILFINEANHISFNSYTQMEVRTKETIWLDWNPENEFWWYTDVMPHNDVDFLTLTYRDNEALDERIVQSIESRRHNKNWWKVYGLGQLGEVEERIYKGWQIIDEIPHEARLAKYGLDFGYSNDPSAGVAIYDYNGGYILDEVVYQKGLSNKQLSDVFLTLDRSLIIADSAEPKSIDELSSYGLNVVPSKKGKDSVLHGIQFVQEQQISVTKRSLNIIKEHRNYLWQRDRDDKIINVPEDMFNNAMDAIRYGLANRMGGIWQPVDVGGVLPYVEGVG